VPVQESLDKSEGVTEANMMQYLGIIEQRTNEILQLYATTQALPPPPSMCSALHVVMTTVTTPRSRLAACFVNQPAAGPFHCTWC
jgi:hypothetical protein